jgi:putative CocE/NonD family hydrolase
MRDGAQLSASLYLPELRHQQAPAIFALTAYTADWHHNHARYFAARGYPFLTVDVRGRGNSDGVFHPFGESDGGHGQDGCDISEWLASQPYCDGKVAMWGGSFLGYTQWATARERPRQLATIVPVAAPFRGVDSPIHNNLFRPYTLRWLSLLAGRTVQSKLFADQLFWNRQFKRWFESGLSFRQLDTFVGYPSDVFQEWMSHSMRDAY